MRLMHKLLIWSFEGFKIQAGIWVDVLRMSPSDDHSDDTCFERFCHQTIADLLTDCETEYLQLDRKGRSS